MASTPQKGRAYFVSSPADLRLLSRRELQEVADANYADDDSTEEEEVALPHLRSPVSDSFSSSFQEDHQHEAASTPKLLIKNTGKKQLEVLNQVIARSYLPDDTLTPGRSALTADCGEPESATPDQFNAIIDVR